MKKNGRPKRFVAVYYSIVIGALLALASCNSEPQPKGIDTNTEPDGEQSSGRILDETPEHEIGNLGDQGIPFVLSPHNNWLFQVTLNDVDELTLMFHTATSAVMLTKEGVATKTTTLSFDDKASLQTWGGQHEARVATNARLKMGALEWGGITITEDLNSGHLSDGKFGPHLFDGKILDFRFDEQQLFVRESLPELNGYEKFAFELQHDSMFLKVKLDVGGQTLEHDLMVHSGFGGALLLDTQFVEENALENQLEVTGTRELSDSMGNKLKTKKCRVPSIEIGKLRLEDIPLEIFDGKIREQRWSVLGGDVLKRFDTVIDLENRNIYLKKNALAEMPFAG